MDSMELRYISESQAIEELLRKHEDPADTYDANAEWQEQDNLDFIAAGTVRRD